MLPRNLTLLALPVASPVTHRSLTDPSRNVIRPGAWESSVMVFLFLASLYGCGAGRGAGPGPSPEIVVAVQPATASVSLGESQAFIATVTGTNNTAVTWSVNGVAGGTAEWGTISSAGLYTAPARLPDPPPVGSGPQGDPPTATVTATSQADASKQGSSRVTIISQVAVALEPSSARLPVRGLQTFSATVAGSPDKTVRWSVNGIVGGDRTFGTIDTQGNYAAPAMVPNPSTVSVEATSAADPSRRAAAAVAIHVRISITPSSASLAPGGAQLFTSTVEGTSNPAVTWSVNGVAGGDSTVGTITSNGQYTAPASPASASVEVTATSQFDPSQSAAATITFAAGVTVAVAPSNATVVFGGSEIFTATVVGSSDARVEWGVNNQAGGTTETGTISPSGLYQAPATPAMDSVEVEARSVAEPNVVGRAIVRLFGLREIRPRVLSSGAMGPVTLAARGANLDPATTLEINSAARVSSFSGGALRTVLTLADLAQPGNFSVAARTNSGLLSNTHSFVIASLATTPTPIAVSASNPTVTGQDIIVTNDSGQGLATPVKLNLLLLSPLQSGNCSGLAARPVRLKRPLTGSATFGVCIAGDGVGPDAPALELSLSGPGDMIFSNVRTATAGTSGIVVVDLTLAASTASGARSLILHNANQDISIAFGGIVIE